MHTLSLSQIHQASVTRSVALILLSLLSFSPVQANDLQQMYLLAKDYDATMQAAVHDHDSAIQRLPLARSAFLPQINAGFDASLNDVNSDFSATYETTRLSLSISQTLFNRTNSAIVDQAKFGVLQADAQLQAQQQSLILRVANAYFDVLRAQANVEFSQSELQAISRQREQAERRFDVGLVPITDVRDAQAQYDLAVAQEIAASNQLATAREALLVVSGSNPELLAPLTPELPLVSPDPADIDAWVSLAKEQNLELVAARLANQTAQAVVAAERGARYPTLNLLGSAFTSTTEQNGRDDLDGGELRLEVRLPLLTGGRINAQVAQARASARSSAQQLVLQERSTVQQTRDAYRGVVANISRVRALNQALISTQKSAEATEAGFRAGTRTSVDVLRALRDTYRAQSDFAGARYDYIINTLTLKAAAGTLSESDVIAISDYLVAES